MLYTSLKHLAKGIRLWQKSGQVGTRKETILISKNVLKCILINSKNVPFVVNMIVICDKSDIPGLTDRSKVSLSVIV